MNEKRTSQPNLNFCFKQMMDATGGFYIHDTAGSRID
jgi:hypothetical protein